MRRCKRGYFEFEAKSDGLYLTVYPPLDGDKAVAVSEVMHYIEKKRLGVSVILSSLMRL